ncbi:MAG: hypothetical protein IJP98_05010 [Clostridia bacterium]|nr:hypothetical protein [Clostridia bacterium]
MKRKVLICIVLSFLILAFGCNCSSQEGYSRSKFAKISKLVQDNDACIRNCYEAVAEIKDENTSFLYINSEKIEKTDLNGEMINTQNTVEELQTPFKELKGLRGITTRNNALDFGGWGSVSSSIGFLYSPDESITIQDLLPADATGEICVMDQDTYFWEQTDGDNSVFFKRITTSYYYYEMWF